MNSVKSLIFPIGLLVFGLTIVAADVSHLATPQNNSTALPVTDVCLGCICEAASGCDRSLKCSGEVCGLFRITWPYWADSGKPTQNGESADSPTAYANCANEPFCAARAIQGYMRRFGQDCNGDNRVDCLDYARIHKFGGYGCRGELEPKYKNAFDECISHFLNKPQ